jgi:GNAT superfamily N-acetyltransferase
MDGGAQRARGLPRKLTLGPDPELVGKWLRGWALSREKPAPEPIVGGWRVEVNEPDQVARYVFPRADETVQHLTQAIHPALTPIKICAAPDDVSPLLTPPWIVQRTSPMMTKPSLTSAPLDQRDDYFIAVTGAGDVLIAMAVTRSGDVVAGGRVALVGDVAVLDQISTQEMHQRRGLGSSVVRTLENAAADRGARRGALVATEAGCDLYRTLGWTIYAPYTTAFVPNGEPEQSTHPNWSRAASEMQTRRT